jgi:hypothetical protein
MKHLVAFCLMAALALPIARAKADEPQAAANPVVVLSSGYVNPDSGASATWFTYHIKYWNTANVPPDHVWVGIWWGSASTRYWYEMSPLDASNTDYADGAWYTFGIWGLDGSAHFFRFVVQTQGALCYWPSPEGTYQPGPTVAGAAVRMGSVTATSFRGPRPSIVLEADQTQVSSGEYVTFTATVTLSDGATAIARGVTVAYTPDEMFDAVDGTAPALIRNTATGTWSQGSTATPAVKVRVVGRSEPLYPAAQAFIADCGDLSPGESAVCTFRCRAQ